MKGESIARGIASNWVGVALAVIISFFMSPFVVRELGGVYYGIWALTLQFTGYLGLLDFGVREAIVRYTSKYAARQQPRLLNEVLGTALLSYAPIVGASLLITAVCTWAVPGPFDIEPQFHASTRWAVLLTGLTITSSLFFNVFTGVVMGLRRFDVSNVISIASLLVRSGMIILLLGSGFGLVALALTQFLFAVLSGVATAVAAARLLRRRNLSLAPSLPNGKRLRAMLRRIFGFGAYALIHSVGQKVIFASDAIVVGAFVSVAAVTPYSIAGSLIQYLRTLLMSTVRVFIPASSELHAQGEFARLEKLIVRAARLGTLIVLPISIVLAVLGDEFLRLWMNEAIARDAKGILLVLALTQIVSAPSYALVGALYGTSKLRFIALMRAAEAAANLGLSIALGVSLGSIGVALGTAISHTVFVTLVLPYFVCPQLNVRRSSYFLSAYARPLVAALPLLAATVLVRAVVQLDDLLTFFGMVSLLMPIYAIGVFFVGLDDEDRTMIRLRLFGRSG